MAENKTKATPDSVEDFINSLDNAQKRQDSLVIIDMMKQATGEEPRLWVGGLIGFGEVRHKSPSGREVDWFKVGFAPRKANLSLYFMDVKILEEALTRLGKYKTGGGCIYVNKLADINIEVLQEIVDISAKHKWYSM